MSWSAITASEVLQEFNPKEQGKIQDIQGAATNLAAILARVVNAARGAIRAGGNQVGPDGTIPDQVREDVIAIARWRWIISLPATDNESLQSKARQKAHDDGQARLDKISAGDIKTEVPAIPQAGAGPSHGVAVPRPGRKINTGSFDGISQT